MSPTVLIIDDEPGVLGTIASVLSDEGYNTLSADSGVKGLDLYKEEQPDVVFLDTWLPDRDGLELLQELRDHDPQASVITTELSMSAPRSRAHKTLPSGEMA